MKAALYEDVRTIKMIDIQKPVADAGQVVVKVKYCGICGTDTHSYMHEGILSPGTIFGHETVGVIESIGDGVEGFEIGERVAVGAPGSCPEHCFFCRSGRTTLCVNGFTRTLGIGPGTQGAFAEYVRADYPDQMLIKIPDSVSFEDAVLFDIFTTAYHGFKRSSFQAGGTAVIIGSGAIGVSMVQLLKLAGAKKVIVLDTNEKKRDFAESCGADHVFDPTTEASLVDTIKEICGGVGPDIVYECAGNPAAVGTAVEVVRPAGEVILIGTNPEPLSTINEIQIGLNELDLKGSFAYTGDEIKTVLNFMEQGLLKVDGMLNKIYPLDQVVEALDELSQTTEPVRYALEP